MTCRELHLANNEWAFDTIIRVCERFGDSLSESTYASLLADGHYSDRKVYWFSRDCVCLDSECN